MLDIQAFRAITEDLGKAILIFSEVTDSTARFKPATKYKGVVVWDEGEVEWHVVFDLGWAKSKIPGIPCVTLRQQARLALGA
jgi:hypothetical protein